jgi:subtilase family serine protease
MTIIQINANSTVTFNRLQKSAVIAGFKIINEDENTTIIRIETDDDVKLDEWILSESLENNSEIEIIYNKINTPFKPYFTKNQVHNNLTNLQNPKLPPIITPKLTYFTAKQIATIYGFSQPQPNIVNVIGIISFGGGLFGTVDASGVLTNGDVQAYWASIGISPASYPVVKIVLIDGERNLPIQNDGATIENTIDVQMVGTCCTSSSTIIILYIAPNSDLGFLDVINTALNVPINVNGILVKPTTISISWGAPEIYYYNSLRNSLNRLFQSATNAGINIFVASGDNGSSDGIPGTINVDFPASSPYVIGCGGTNLICPNLSYDNSTVETTWNGSGGGFSKIFSIPTYQTSLNLSQNFRAVPDIAGVADPNTGVIFRIGGASYIIGGTSIVAPAYAGFIASLKLNYFILPRIYTYTSLSFHDVVIGNNGEYSAKVGYDNNTGLGSLNGSIIGPLLISNNIVPPSPPVIVTGITLNVTTLLLNPTQTSQLIPTITPANASNKNINWTNSNTNVATVSNTGLVRAIGNGTAIIRSTTVDQSKVATVSVTVLTSIVPVTGITLNVSTIRIRINTIRSIIATIIPPTASNISVVWSSSNPTICRVNTSGIIRAISRGSAIVTARTVDGNKTATVTVTVF